MKNECANALARAGMAPFLGTARAFSAEVGAGSEKKMGENKRPGPLLCLRGVAPPLLAPRLGAHGHIGGCRILEPPRLTLPAGANPSPLFHEQNAAEEIRQDIEAIEVAHVARGVDAVKEEGGLRELRQAMEVFRHGLSREKRSEKGEQNEGKIMNPTTGKSM
jgi:hypothetical protein